MMYLKTISIAASFLIATIFENQSYLVLLLIVAGFFLYWHLFHYLSIQKERNFLKEENQYFIDSFQSIRNPITLVHVPLRTICNDNCPENIKNDLSLAIRNIECLNENLDKLSGLKYLHNHPEVLNITEHELGNYLRNRICSLQGYATNKHIKLIIKTEFTYASVWFDKNKISPIIDKFITNAIDCSEPESNITLLISISQEHWEISVPDSGNGKLTKLYNQNKHRMIRQKAEFECHFSKSMLLKKLADLCNGKILVSNINHTVTLRFPVKCSCEDQSNHSPLCFTNHTEIEKIDRLLVKAPCKRNSHKPTVVLADSNDDFRSYLTSCLTEEFTIKSFRDGGEAMTCIKNEYPDLVICDTELQNMDGVELSSRLKTSCETSIIPIILYSSHIDIDQYNRRKTSLADTFLQQPFSIADLKIEMSILIKNNRFLRKSFLQRLFGEEFLEIKASEILQDGEHPLISKVTKIILENLNNEKLTIGSIAKELGISRTSLYNKWTQLTGEALNKFILKIRMEKAHEMLESGKYRVNEIPENIGMKDMDHFRDNYKKHFGKTPAHTIKNV